MTFTLFNTIYKKTHTLWKHPTLYSYSHIPEFLLWQVHRQVTRLSEVIGKSQWTFLTLWPWPLTYDLDLQTWPRYPSTWPPCQNSSAYVCPFGRESETDRHTDRVKTITSITSETWGVKINNKYSNPGNRHSWLLLKQKLWPLLLCLFINSKCIIYVQLSGEYF